FDVLRDYTSSGLPLDLNLMIGYQNVPFSAVTSSDSLGFPLLRRVPALGWERSALSAYRWRACDAGSTQRPTERIRPSFFRMKANNAASDSGEPLTIHTLNFNSAFKGSWLAIFSSPNIGIHTLSAILFAVSASGTTPAPGGIGLCRFKKLDIG